MPLEREESFLSLEKETLERKKLLEKEEKIKREAKLILDKFAKALEKIKTEESFVEREEDRRKVGDGNREENPDSEFRKIFFENAPSIKKECIEAERGKWK